MKNSVITSLALALGSASASPLTRRQSANPYEGFQVYPDPYYVSEIEDEAIPAFNDAGDTELAEKAKAVEEIGTFFWIDVNAKVPDIGPYLQGIQEANADGADPPYVGQIVVYDLPNRDCAAESSAGEYLVGEGGDEKYRAYVDGIVEQVNEYSDVNIVMVIEPDSLANLVTNIDVEKCAEAEESYRDGVAYALEQLDLPNVANYVDGGHSGWLGWPDNLDPAAQLFAEVYEAAGSPASARGLALNVANYNGLLLDSAPEYTDPNPNYDEDKYATAMGPALDEAGWTGAHFIVDQGRSGVQPTEQTEQGDWCNVIGTGFGMRPSTDTGNDLIDAIVWVKPGGEADGTSDDSSERYDSHCSLGDALQPAPEAGTWFQDYFEQLLVNADPPF